MLQNKRYFNLTLKIYYLIIYIIAKIIKFKVFSFYQKIHKQTSYVLNNYDGMVFYNTIYKLPFLIK